MPDAHRTYQLFIRVPDPLTLTIGRLGTFTFPAGHYVYTGSARRNLDTRVARHLRRDKTARWHIDYLLLAPGVTVLKVQTTTTGECELNQQTTGFIPVPGFGASDCRVGCISHLKIIGNMTT